VAYRLPAGGLVIDFPGVRGYSPPLPAPAQVQSGYVEIAGLSRGCRFANCLHQEEPGCSVKAAVDAGQVSARRYESYLHLLRLAQRLDGPRARNLRRG
jgi:ribosome biogenesis GTPase